MRNKSSDLNNHLFAEIERLGDEDLTPEQLVVEQQRAKAIALVARQIIGNAKVALDASKLQLEYSQRKAEEIIPETLLIENAKKKN